MLDGILNIVKEQVAGVIDSNENVPADKKEAAVEATTSTLVDSVKEHVTSGDFSAITNLFSGDSVGTNGLQSTIVSTLSEKVGLSKDIAESIAGAIIPAITSALSSKSGDSGGVNLESIVETVTSNKGGGIIGAIRKLFGR